MPPPKHARNARNILDLLTLEGVCEPVREPAFMIFVYPCGLAIADRLVVEFHDRDLWGRFQPVRRLTEIHQQHHDENRPNGWWIEMSVDETNHWLEVKDTAI